MRTANRVIEEEFLVIRAKLLEVAAFYDRLSESHGENQDPDQATEDQEACANKLALLNDACSLLVSNEGRKAERLQLLFSREYDTDWRSKFGL